MEAETNRANRAIEALRAGELSETTRSDKAREKISRYEAKTNRKQWKTAAKTAKTTRKLNKAGTREKKASAAAIPINAQANLISAKAKKEKNLVQASRNLIDKWIAEKNLQAKYKQLKIDARDVRNKEAQTGITAVNNLMDKAMRLYSERMKDKISKREYRKELEKIKKDEYVARVGASAKMYGQTDADFKQLDSATKNLINLIDSIIPF